MENTITHPATEKTALRSPFDTNWVRPLVFRLLAGFALTLPLTGYARSEPNAVCPPVGIWINPANGKRIEMPELMEQLAKKPIVLLGESHISAEHHRWQLQIISALYSRNPNMIIGFESFPRSVQPVLDQWTKGDLGEQEFLKKSEWFKVWKFDPDLYMPLFHFARMNRIPMRALNVERSLTRQIGKQGWAAIPTDQRRGLSDPAAPSAAYLKSLREVFGEHSDNEDEDDADSEAKEIAFKRFLEVQLTWDRAMAEALVHARNGGDKPLVIGIIGRGHLEYRYGVPRQLDDLGISGSAVLLPSDSGPPCSGKDQAEQPAAAVANALFGVVAPEEPDQPPHPMLGVQIETIDNATTKAVRIIKVTKESIAEKAGLLDGDLIIQAAGQDITKLQELVTIIQRQAPGTWLPLVILRDDQRLEIIARFPASS